MVDAIDLRLCSTPAPLQSSAVTTPEARAREVIDAQLAAAGWLVQDRGAMNRSAGLGLAVREYPLATGPCDYLLLVAGKACGVVEAKAAGATLSGVAEQACGYQAAPPVALARWSDPLRFDYEASGAELLFSDRLDPEQRSRRVFGFHRPETLHEWLKAGSSLRARLATLPDLITEGLRDCQVDAIEGLEALAPAGPAAGLRADGHRRGQDLHRRQPWPIASWPTPTPGASCSWSTATISAARP